MPTIQIGCQDHGNLKKWQEEAMDEADKFFLDLTCSHSNSHFQYYLYIPKRLRRSCNQIPL